MNWATQLYQAVRAPAERTIAFWHHTGYVTAA